MLPWNRRAQVPCGYERAGETCAASVCLEQMAAHYKEAHGAKICGGLFIAKIFDDGSKFVEYSQIHTFPTNDKGWFIFTGVKPIVFRTVIGGAFAFDLEKIGADDIRFGVRQLSRPPRHRLASVKVHVGPVGGTCFQYVLSRALAAEERLGDDALCAGTPPPVVRVDPAFLAPALVHTPGAPALEKPWELAITLSLVFQVVRET